MRTYRSTGCYEVVYDTSPVANQSLAHVTTGHPRIPITVNPRQGDSLDALRRVTAPNSKKDLETFSAYHRFEFASLTHRFPRLLFCQGPESS